MDNKPKSVSIAKWGAACSPCALAKAKCLRSNDSTGSKCDRCERLEKDCVNQVHKPRKKRQSKPSKTAQLEERLNSLVDLLKATNSGEVPTSARASPDILRADTLGVPTEAGPASASGSTRHKRASVGGDGPGASIKASLDALPEPLRVIPRSYNEYAPPACICRAQVSDVPIPVESDEALLSTFASTLMPEYPFITLRPGITAAELASTKPFLFATIKMVSSYRNLRSMRAQNYLVTRHLSEQLLMRSERSLELLQALLLVLRSYHYHCMMHAQMNNFAVLANSVAADLGINRAPELQERTKLLLPHHEAPQPRTNEERRALCGVWYMNSCVSLAFQRLDPIRFSPYLEQCLRELEINKEYDSDLYLVNLVRIQHLTERISRLHAKDRVEDDLPPGVARAPTNVYLNAFQNELDRYKNALPLHLRSNKLIICHINSATLRLWEPPIIDAGLLEKISNSFQTMTLGVSAPSYHNTSQSQQLDIFYRSNAALKTWFQFWLSIDAADYFSMPLPACAQLINAVTMLSRWAKLSSPDIGGGGGLGGGNGFGQQVPGGGGMMTGMMAGSSSTDANQSVMDPSSGVSSAVPSVAGSPTQTHGHGQQPMPTPSMMYHRPHPHPDPTIPAAVSAIKAHFLAQPELQIDILGILQAMVTRFEGARRDVIQQQQQQNKREGQGSGGNGNGNAAVAWENNMWELAARKISLTRLKLERWADIVASMGGEALLMGRRYGDSTTTAGSEGSTESDSDMADPPPPTSSGNGIEKSSSYPVEALETTQPPPAYHGFLPTAMMVTPPQPQEGGVGGIGGVGVGGVGGWQPTQSWANDLFEGLGLDQNFFFDGPGDYGTVVLNSLGPNNGM